MSIINGKIQYGSQLNWFIRNGLEETLRVVSMHLTDGTDWSTSELGLDTDLAAGASTGWGVPLRTLPAAGRRSKHRKMSTEFVVFWNIYIFAKSIYMSSATLRRKLIDIPPVVFEKLTVKAGREGVSLKRYIENLLEQDTAGMGPVVPEGVTAPGIISLIGIAKGKADVDWEDERLKYLLSK